ncbi:hypothetical protein ACJMK2_009589 [Sinanodonta woodiana]|uniref:F-box domain-containing protein n=1 Tax=Sinanodonta woodiana TaxID=1069815 RepID=A0ABD3VD00_SINWO
MHLLDLPPELLTTLLAYLPARDLARVCQTCIFLRDLARTESLWQQRCRKEYKLKTNKNWNASYFEIYSKVLIKYGALLGAWKTTMNCYGGLFNVTYCLGQILVEEYFPTKCIFDSLKSIPWFSISLENGEATVKCLQGFDVPHPGDVKFDQEEVKDGKHTVTTNLICLSSHQEENEDSEEFQRWIEQEKVRGTIQELLEIKWQLTKEKKHQLQLSPLVLPPLTPDRIIQPGLFKGTYSAHGTELLMLSYSDETQEIHLTKITGDPNVPAGEISVYVDLRRPMILNREQQESLQTLKDIDTPDLPPEFDGTRNFSQPFIVPRQCEMEDCRDLPTFCKARYHSKGTIAAFGYQNPTFSNNHWIMISEDVFGVLWLDLYSFSLFNRIKEEFKTS